MTPRLSRQIDVVLVRMDALKAALDNQPGRTEEVEFQYDWVLRAITKLQQSLHQQQ